MKLIKKKSIYKFMNTKNVISGSDVVIIRILEIIDAS
jgi:hypothetical protein